VAELNHSDACERLANIGHHILMHAGVITATPFIVDRFIVSVCIASGIYGSRLVHRVIGNQHRASQAFAA
jgi:hypothetical protein